MGPGYSTGLGVPWSSHILGLHEGQPPCPELLLSLFLRFQLLLLLPPHHLLRASPVRPHLFPPPFLPLWGWDLPGPPSCCASTLFFSHLSSCYYPHPGVSFLVVHPGSGGAKNEQSDLKNSLNLRKSWGGGGATPVTAEFSGGNRTLNGTNIKRGLCVIRHCGFQETGTNS